MTSDREYRTPLSKLAENMWEDPFQAYKTLQDQVGVSAARQGKNLTSAEIRASPTFQKIVDRERMISDAGTYNRAAEIVGDNRRIVPYISPSITSNFGSVKKITANILREQKN
jgi:hypothetical protein